MIGARLGWAGEGPLLVLGAHADDIEIGCGGTVLELVKANPGIEAWWAVFSGAGERACEARASAAAFLAGTAGAHVLVERFRDGFFPMEASAIKERFESLKAQVRPAVVLTHQRNDLHQDHRLIAELTWNTFRDAVILEYEIPKWDGDLGTPNAFMPIARETADRKIALLHEHFPSQRERDWFDDETFRSLLRLRGMECRSPSRYAEAFYSRKLVLSPDAGCARTPEAV